MHVILPGYTHLQHAQPVLLAHHLMAYYEMLQRDDERFAECLKRTNVLPLGSAALAGTSFPIDMELTAQYLDFPRVTRNSMDAVSDRDYLIEFNAAGAIFMMHVSRLAEELILWSTKEFGFIEIFMISTSTVAIYTRFAPLWIALLGYALALILLLGSTILRGGLLFYLFGFL